MYKNSKNVNTNLFIKSFLIGSFSGFIIIILFSLIASVLTLLASGVSDFFYLIVSNIIFVLGAFFGGYISGRVNKEKGLIIGITAGFILSIITLCTSLIIGNFEGNVFSLVKIIIAVLSSGIGGIISVNRKKSVVI